MVEQSLTKVIPMADNNNYCYVTWDVDLTGKRLIDEICQLAAYTPTLKFQQFIMPHRDIDVVAKKKHMIKTVNVGRYRVLKDTRNGKVLKTKSELYALMDFITWLENLKGQSKGIILLNFEPFKLAPSLLIEALKRCQLFNRFSLAVCGFINIYPFVKDKCSMSMTSFTLRILSKILLNKDNEDVYSACDRARLVYQILNHLCAGDSDDEIVNIYNNVYPLLKTVTDEDLELTKFKEVLQLQKTLKPIFFGQFMNPAKRKRATYLRRLLTTNQVDYAYLQNIISHGQENLELCIRDKVCPESETDAKELIEIISTHFNRASVKNDKKNKLKKNSLKHDTVVMQNEDVTNNVEENLTEVVNIMQATNLSDNQC